MTGLYFDLTFFMCFKFLLTVANDFYEFVTFVRGTGNNAVCLQHKMNIHVEYIKLEFDVV